MRACGFVHSTFVTLPVSSIGLLRSNSAANEWWAWLAATGLNAKTAATPAHDSRLIGAPLLLVGDDTLSARFRTIESGPSREQQMTSLLRLCAILALLVPMVAGAQW